MVVAWHAEGQVGLGGTRVLQSGIEFFFIISGFVMYIVGEESTAAPGAFMVRRLARVVPLYWVLTSVVALVALAAPRLLQTIRLDPAHLVASYLFIPWTNPTPGVGLRPLLIPGWTLNYEMAFYALIAASLWAPRRWRAALTIGVLAGLALVGCIARPNPFFGFYTSPLVSEFALGVIVAMIVRALPPGVLRWGAPIAVLGAGLLLSGGAAIDAQASFRLVLFGGPVMLIVCGAAMWEKSGELAEIAPLKLLGDASYPLYMVHTLLLSALAQIMRHTGVVLAPGWFVAVGLVVSAVSGVVLHFTVEKPVTRWLQTRLASRANSKTAKSVNPALVADARP